MEMCIHGNQVLWQINHCFIRSYFKYQPPSFICSPIMLAPVISSLDEIYCTFREKIEIHALKRIAAMSNSSTMMQNQIFNCRDYAFTGTRDTNFERAMKISGINEAVNCYLCTMNCEHDCVGPF